MCLESGFPGNSVDRGQSEVIGVVLLLSITVVVITAISASGAGVLGDAQSDSRIAQTENSMSQMSSKANLVALGQSDVHSFSLGDVGDGTVSIEEEGHITVKHDDEDEQSEPTIIVEDLPLGAITYEEGSTTIAYQGGGVWKKQEGHTTMVSPPQFHYRGNTLTFPIVTLEGADSASGSVTGQAEKVGEEELYPGEEGSNPLEEGEVTIEVHSRYCQGWQGFFESRTSGTVKEPCDSSETDTVEIRLDVPNPLELDSATTYINYADTGGNATIQSEKKVNSFPSVEPTIDDEVEKCRNGDCEELEDSEDDDPLTPGDPYYVEAEDDPYSLGERDFEPDEDDVELVIDGDLEIDDDLDVDATDDGGAKIYVNGDLNIQGANINAGNTSGDASKLTIYVADQIDQPGSGSTEVYAVIYAPNNTAPEGCTGNERWSGDVDVYGAVLVESMCVGGNTDLYYDENLDGILDLETETSLIRYLHVTENRIEVEVS